MSEMVKRVARALCVASGKNPNRVPAINSGSERGAPVPDVARPDWMKFIPTAKAAIEAMREPTIAMTEAMINSFGCVDPRDPDDGQIRASAMDIYAAAINAAINEKSPAPPAKAEPG